MSTWGFPNNKNATITEPAELYRQKQLHGDCPVYILFSAEDMYSPKSILNRKLNVQPLHIIYKRASIWWGQIELSLFIFDLSSNQISLPTRINFQFSLLSRMNVEICLRTTKILSESWCSLPTSNIFSQLYNCQGAWFGSLDFVTPSIIKVYYKGPGEPRRQRHLIIFKFSFV